MTTVILLLLVLFFVLVNGYFVAAEFAVVRTRPSRMQHLADEGDRRAEIALRQLDHVDGVRLPGLLHPRIPQHP